jgi:anti-anti-sigma factor
MNTIPSVSTENVGFEIRELAGAPDAPDMLKLVGALDADAAPRLSDELERRLLAGQTEVWLNFSEVSFISSAGVGSLIASVGEYRDSGGDITITDLAPELLRVFELLDLLDFLSLE